MSRYIFENSKLKCIRLRVRDTPQEAARYLETYKAYEQKSAESIQEKVRAFQRVT